ncbi:hypothetical protein A2U01_0118575, partial [Trifolium medium]|nr:hypothetical protein [Trifolium medium]
SCPKNPRAIGDKHFFRRTERNTPGSEEGMV